MTGGVELIGDLAGDQKASALHTMKVNINKVLKMTAHGLRQLPDGPGKAQIEGILAQSIEQMRGAGGDLQTLTRGYGSLLKLNRLIKFRMSDIGRGGYDGLGRGGYDGIGRGGYDDVGRGGYDDVGRGGYDGIGEGYGSASVRPSTGMNRGTRYQQSGQVRSNIGRGGYDDIGATGTKGQWKRLVFGHGSDPIRSQEVVVTQPQPTDISGVGSGYGDDYDDFGYYMDIAGADSDSIPLDEPVSESGSQYRGRTPNNPQWEVPNRPGAAPFEARVAEVPKAMDMVGPGRVLKWHPESEFIKNPMRGEIPSDSRHSKFVTEQFRSRKAKKQYGESADARKNVHRMKGGGEHSSRDSRKYEAILDDIGGGRGRPTHYVEAQRGGGHTIIMDINDYDESLDFRYGSGPPSQSRTGDLGLSSRNPLPMNILRYGQEPEEWHSLPDIGFSAFGWKPGMFAGKALEAGKSAVGKVTGIPGAAADVVRDTAGDFVEMGQDIVGGVTGQFGNLVSKGYDLVRDIVSKLIAQGKNLRGLIRNAREKAQEYAAQGFKAAYDKIKGVEQRLVDRLSSIKNTTLNLIKGAKKYAYDYAAKAFRAAKRYTGKAFSASKRYAGALYKRGRNFTNSQINRVTKPIKDTMDTMKTVGTVALVIGSVAILGGGFYLYTKK